MLHVDAIGASNAVLRDARFLAGRSSESIDALRELSSGAQRSLTLEQFKFNEPQLVAAVGERARHIPVTLHGDSQYLADPVEYAVHDLVGVRVSGHGESPIKLHTKVGVADGERWVVGTAAPVEGLYRGQQVDYAALGDDPEIAAWLERSTHAAARGDTQAAKEAAAELARRGLFQNDPTHGIHLLTQRLTGMLGDRSATALYTSSKILGDRPSMDLLALQEARGARVLVETSPKAPLEEVEQARAAGISQVVQTGIKHNRGHGNLLVVEHRSAAHPERSVRTAYMGTAMLSPRGMTRPEFGRQARELGFITQDQAAIEQALDAVQSLPGSQLRSWRA